MDLHQTIVNARKRKGLTQEELAELTHVTARTIQRIESGDSTPRHHTLKAIAQVLDLPYDALTTEESSAVLPETSQHPGTGQDDDRYFLRLLCLSCYSFLVVPFVHFLLPAYLLKRRTESNVAVVTQARKIILHQIYWVVALNAVMLLILIINFLLAFSGSAYYINYLHPVFAFYAGNLIIIMVQYIRLNQGPATYSTTV